MTIEKFSQGQQARSTILVDEDYVRSFAKLSGDNNPLHVDPEFAKRTKFRRIVAHGLSYSGIISQIIGMELPGPGALWLSQNLEFHLPVFIGDEIEMVATVSQISISTNTMKLIFEATNQDDETVLTGEATVQLLELDDIEEETGPEKRLALIIGGSRGIGASVAQRLFNDGLEVAITYRKSSSDVKLLQKENQEIAAFQADAADSENASRLVNQIIQKFGRAPDTVVFCASAPIVHLKTGEADYSQFEKQLDVALKGTHAIANILLPYMVKNKFGRFVGVSSTASLANPAEKMAPYIVAKAAFNSFLQCLAVDYGPLGIRSNIVAPSMTNTAMLAKFPERQVQVAAAQNPSRRLGHPKDIAGTVSFLVSDDGDYINGETIIVSGGSLIK